MSMLLCFCAPLTIMPLILIYVGYQNVPKKNHNSGNDFQRVVYKEALGPCKVMSTADGGTIGLRRPNASSSACYMKYNLTSLNGGYMGDYYGGY